MSNLPQKPADSDAAPAPKAKPTRFVERPYTGTGYMIGVGKPPGPKPKPQPPAKTYPRSTDQDEAGGKAMEQATNEILAERKVQKPK